MDSRLEKDRNALLFLDGIKKSEKNVQLYFLQKLEDILIDSFRKDIRNGLSIQEVVLEDLPVKSELSKRFIDTILVKGIVVNTENSGIKRISEEYYRKIKLEEFVLAR